eukprot:2650239-Prymnesium_polylepis.2
MPRGLNLRGTAELARNARCIGSNTSAAFVRGQRLDSRLPLLCPRRLHGDDREFGFEALLHEIHVGLAGQREREQEDHGERDENHDGDR